MKNQAVQAHLDSVSLLAQAICSSLDQELLKLGFPQGRFAVAPHTDAEYRLRRDPASRQHTLIGVWRDAEGFKCGELVFRADGAFFAEYDVIRVHPRRPRWLVEAVTAWGRGSTIKSEARLLPAIG